MIMIRKLAVAASLAATVASSFAAMQLGGATSDLTWANGNHWYIYPNTFPAGFPPSASDTVYFEDLLYTTGYTNVIGAVVYWELRRLKEGLSPDALASLFD